MSFHRYENINHMPTAPGRLLFSRRSRITSVFLLLIALIAAVVFYPGIRRFTIMETDTGRVIFCSDVKPGDTFKVSYTHSVNRSLVEDVFEVTGDYGIMLKKTVFRSFGAGIPEEPEAGQKLEIYDDRLEITGMDMKLNDYVLFVGTIAGHRFTMGDSSFRLDNLTGQQKAVRFGVVGLNIYKLFFMRYAINNVV